MQKNKDLKNFVYHELKKKLVNCDYEPGSLLNEAQLATEYGLSRTPIREAISRLEIDGYLKIIPKKGVFVTNISLSNVLQIFQTRIEIEPLTLRMAVPYLNVDDLMMFRNKFLHDDTNITDAFKLDTAMHLFIIEHCGNSYLIDMMHRVFDDNTRVVIASKQNEVKIHDAKLEHIEILDSLINGDAPEKTAQLMRAHVETCKKAALNYFSTLEAYHATPSSNYRREILDLINQ